MSRRGYLQADHANRVTTVVCDIDGVLADNTHRNVHLGRGERPTDWTAFHADQHLDPCLEGNATLLRMLWHGGFRIWLLSNRPEGYADVTATWLRRHGIIYDRLTLRPDGAKYSEFKPGRIAQWMADGVAIGLFIDDDPLLCQSVEQSTGVPVLYVHSGYYEDGHEDLAEFEAHQPDTTGVAT